MVRKWDDMRGGLNDLPVDPAAYQRLSEAISGATSQSGTFGAGYEEIVAPTTDPGRPRAFVCGYAWSIQTLIIVFRNDGPGKQDKRVWIMYEDVSDDEWQALKGSVSTHSFVNTFLNGRAWTKIGPGMQPKARPDHFKDGQGV